MEIGLSQHADMTVAQLLESDLEDGAVVQVAGLVGSINHRVARNSGNPYAQATLEDFSGELSILLLGKSYQENQGSMQPDGIVSVRGRVQRRDDEVTMHAQQVQVLNLQASTAASSDGPLTFTVPETFATADVLQRFDEALERHPGPSEVRLRLVKDGVARVFSLPRRVEVSTDLIGEVKSVLGRDCLDQPQASGKEAATR